MRSLPITLFECVSQDPQPLRTLVVLERLMVQLLKLMCIETGLGCYVASITLCEMQRAIWIARVVDFYISDLSLKSDDLLKSNEHEPTLLCRDVSVRCLSGNQVWSQSCGNSSSQLYCWRPGSRHTE
jgi:hypothetical protein